MTTDPGLLARYDDILVGEGEDLLPAVAELDAALGHLDPPPRLATTVPRWAASLESNAGALDPAAHRWLRRPGPPRFTPIRRRLTVPIAAVLIVLLVGATALAVGFFNRAVQRDPGAQTVQGQMVTIDQTNQVGDYSVVVQKAYADANRLILVYTVRPPSGEVDDAAAIVGATAVTPDGTQMPWSDSIIENVVAGTGDGLISFDSSGITGDPGSISVHLAVQQLYVVGPNNPKGDPHGPKAVPANAVFDFSVPFHPGRSNSPNVSATYKDRAATVRRVVVAPSETRVYVALAGVNPTWAEITGSDGTSIRMVWFSLAPGGIVLGFPATAPAGPTWSLVLGEKPLPNGSFEPGTPVWHFTIPAP